MSIKKMEDGQMVQFQQPSKNISVYEDSDRNLVVLRVYGTIEEPEAYIDEISRLEQLSKKYSIVEVLLNSPGGSLNTTVDLASILQNFDYIVTVGKGEVASGAFMLWSLGDLRVVTKYSMYMAHRESYGMYGKTSEHKDAANVFESVYEDLFKNCFGSLLTEKEQNIAERSEAWVSYSDLLKRPRVISYEEYKSPKNPYYVKELFVLEDGTHFVYNPETETYEGIDITYNDSRIVNIEDYLYGLGGVQFPEESAEVDIEQDAKKNKKKNVKSDKKKKDS